MSLEIELANIDDAIDALSEKSIEDIRNYASTLNITLHKNVAKATAIARIQKFLVDQAETQSTLETVEEINTEDRIAQMSARERRVWLKSEETARRKYATETVIVNITCHDDTYVPKAVKVEGKAKVAGALSLYVANADTPINKGRRLVPVNGTFATSRLQANVMSGLLSTVEGQGVFNEGQGKHTCKQVARFGGPAFTVREVDNPEHFKTLAKNRIAQENAKIAQTLASQTEASIEDSM